MCESEPVLGQCVVDQLVLVALPGHVSSEAKERGDVDSVNMLCVLNITAQIKLCEDTLPRLLLTKKKKKKTTQRHYIDVKTEYFWVLAVCCTKQGI